jgi:AcrR family transcriptional regulator
MRKRVSRGRRRVYPSFDTRLDALYTDRYISWVASHRAGARQALYETALDLFTRFGYDAVGIQQIVAAAGLSKPTLYHYFGSKRGLLEEICANSETALFSELSDVFDYQGDLPVTLANFVGRILRFATRHPGETRLILALQHGPVESEAREVIRPTVERLAARTAELFTAAAAQHGNMRGREAPYTASFLGLCFTYAELLLDGDVGPSEDLPYRIMHQFSYGIYS